MLHINFHLKNEFTLIYASFVLRLFLDQTSNIDKSPDGNGIMFAPMCKADVDSKCFTSTNEKACEHKVNAVELDTVEDFVVFPSRFYHRGYYRIASNMTYYTAQLFCKILDNPEAWQNVTRKVNQITIQGCIQESWLAQLTQDIRNNWNTMYVLCQCIFTCKGIQR